METMVNIGLEHFKVERLLKASEVAYDAYMRHSLWHERGCTYMDAPMEDLRNAIDSLIKHVENGQAYAGPLE